LFLLLSALKSEKAATLANESEYAFLTMKRLPLTLVAIALSICALAQTPPSSPLEGIWLGTLHNGNASLRLQFHLHHDTDNQATWTCTLDSLDQNAVGIPCTVTSAANPITIEIPAVQGKWSGNLTADKLDGAWTQGSGLPLILERQASAIKPAPPRQPDAALPPADAKSIQSILDKDLASALASGALAPSTHAGVTIGVVSHGQRNIFTYGTAKPDSLFEIGSISKTFTGLILAQMVEQKSVQLNEPVRELLPPGTVAKPASGPEITLLDLSDQHSGLPRMPDNFSPADPANPYADYDTKRLYAYISAHGIALPAEAPFGYSNLGVGLLGAALANRAKLSYSDLLHLQITGPLNLNDTAIALSPSMRARFIEGHDAAHNPAHAWDLDALAGAGGIRSTAADMLTYLEAQLHPDKLPPSTASTPQGKTLPAALYASQTIHAEVPPGSNIALNWFHIEATDSYWHNGGTGGYSSYALFSPGDDFALIVLFNTAGDKDTFADKLGQHIAQRLSGQPAVSLAP
jgi:D-alanyl-D-alanine-carboxypeptidase/D-alanyl-D-alanine-endopeptidase